MENKTAPSQNSKHLVTYFLLTYVIAWAIEVPLALAKQGVIQSILPQWFHYLVAYAPMLSALIVTWATQGQPGLKELWERITRWRIGGIWWVAAFSPLLLGLVVVLAMNLISPNKISLSELGEVNFLPPLGIGALFLWIFTFGIGEEIGWRGFALPRLQRNHNALSATAILAFFWALWHLPQFFYLFEPGIAMGWAIGLFTGAVVFTWLLNSTNGSILPVAIFHGCFNYVSSSNAGGGLLAAIVSTLVMIWGVAVIFIYKPKMLSSKEKFVIGQNTPPDERALDPLQSAGL